MHGQTVELTRKTTGKVRHIHGFLHFAFAFRAKFTYLKGDQRPQVFFVPHQGITDLTVVGPDPTPDLQGQLGLGPDDANPALSPDDFVWFDATPQDFPPAGVGSIEDYYEATLLPDTAGVFDLAARFTPDQGLTWLYCDLDGSVNGYEVDQAGHVQVNSAQ